MAAKGAVGRAAATIAVVAKALAGQMVAAELTAKAAAQAALALAVEG